MTKDNDSIFKMTHLRTLNKTDLELTSISVTNACNFVFHRKTVNNIKMDKFHELSAERGVVGHKHGNALMLQQHSHKHRSGSQRDN